MGSTTTNIGLRPSSSLPAIRTLITKGSKFSGRCFGRIRSKKRRQQRSIAPAAGGYRIGSARTSQEGFDPIKKTQRELHVAFVDPAGQYRRDCHAILGDPWQPRIVPLSELGAGDPAIPWTSAPVAELPEPPPVKLMKPEK